MNLVFAGLHSMGVLVGTVTFSLMVPPAFPLAGAFLFLLALEVFTWS